MLYDNQINRDYADEIEWSYDCLDRIVINGMFNFGQTPGGFRSWWRLFDPSEGQLSDKGIQTMAGNFSRRITAWANKNSVPVIACGKGVRKDEVSEPHIEHARANNKKGVFLILTGLAPAPVWKVKMSPSGKIRDIHREKPWPFVKHYHFHIMDPEWGHMIIRICGYPPYGVQVIINGHEWVERKLISHGWNIQSDGNCFTGGAGISRAVHLWSNRLFQQEAASDIEKLCERWVYGAVLPFAMHTQERIDSEFQYDWRVYQFEYSRDFIFKSGRVMNEIFQSLIDRSRKRYDLKTVKTIFGVRGRPHKRLRIANEPRGRRDTAFKEVSHPEFDLTVLKLHWKLSSLKLYDKSARLLRAEAVEHNLRKGKLKGRLDNWGVIVKESRDKLLRFINSAELLDHGLLDAGRLDFWQKPTKKGTRRLAGINIKKVRMQAVINALAHLAPVTDGFTRKELTAEVNSLLPRKARCEPRHISYDMNKLKGKGVIERIPKTIRNKINLRKLRPLLTLITLQEKILKPCHSMVIPGKQGQFSTRNKMDEAYETIREGMTMLFDELNIA